MRLKNKHDNVFISSLRIKVAEAQNNFEISVDTQLIVYL